ncbi:MAG: efflux RND transporter permease subunit, partial [Myxococcota bacterium]
MSFTEWAIKNDRVTYVLVLCLIVGGLSYYQTSPKAEDPGFTIKTAKVVTSFPGASAEQVERLVTDRIEEKVQQLPELDDVESSSRPGVSIVSVNVKETYKGGEMRRIWDGLRRKMEEVSSELPQGVLPPMVNDEFGDVFGTVIAITGEGYDYAELKDVADQVRDAVLQVKDVAKVDYYGVQDERVFIDFIPERLAELNLSPAALQQMLQGQNIVSPGGSIDVSNQRLKVEPTGNFAELDDISNALIRPPGAGTSIRLADIANVRHGYVDPPETAFHVNGTPGLALAVSMESGGNIITMGAAIKELVGQLSSEYPIGLDLKIVTFQADDVQSTIDSFTESLLQAVAVVLVCMLLFLGLRTGMVVASLIPMAMATTFVVMSLMDLGLDKVSLAALIIALGLLVDNAVVIAESIMVYMEKGMKPLDAAILSANELRNSLLISSLTTCAAFLPLALADNMMGEFLGPLATVLAITLLGSWALATTAVPLLAVKFLKVEPTDSDFTKKPVYNAYRGILTLCLRHRALFIVGVVGAFFGSLSLFSFLPQKFMSDSALPSFTIELHGAEGTDLEYTEKMTMEIE